MEECCCDVETVDALNQKRIFPLLSPLLKMSFFRFYRVNLNRGCPFWSEDGQCVLRSCHVEECGEVSGGVVRLVECGEVSGSVVRLVEVW